MRVRILSCYGYYVRFKNEFYSIIITEFNIYNLNNISIHAFMHKSTVAIAQGPGYL